MATEWLYWILIFLFFACSLFLLHIPLPHDISDRSKLAVAEFVLRLSNEYLGDLVENIFGAETRNRFTRFFMSLGFIIPIKPPEGIKQFKLKIGGVPCVAYVPISKKSDAIFVFIHGGGWCIGDTKFYDGVLHHFVETLGISAISIDYRLAPEHPFPAGLDDCEAVILDLYRNGSDQLEFDKSKIIVAGDSAGGNLTAAVVHRLIRKNENVVKAQVLIYPVVHIFNFNSPSYQEYWRKYAGTALLNPKHMARWILLYLNVDASKKNIKKLLNSQHVDSDFENSIEFQKHIHYETLPNEFKENHVVRQPKEIDQALAEQLTKIGTNPEVSPIFGAAQGLPPALVLTAGYDVLRDEGIQYAQKLMKAGVPTVWKHYPQAFHGLFNMPKSENRLKMMKEVVDFTVNYI